MGDRILAIDWRTQAVFGTVFHRGRKGFRVVSSARAAIDPTADRMGTGHPTPFERVLEKLAEQTAITGIDCSIVLPTAWFQFHRMHLPFRKRQDIEAVLPFEMAPHLVGAIEEMTLSFQGVEVDGDGSRILAAAIPKTTIDAIAKAAAAYRLQIRRIAPTSDALARVIAACDCNASRREWLLVVAEGSEDVSIVGISKGCVRFLRCLPMEAGFAADANEGGRNRLEAEIRRTLISENEREGKGFEPEAAFLLIEIDGPGWKVAEEGQCLDIGVPLVQWTSVLRSDCLDGASLEEGLWFRMHETASPGEGFDVHPETRRLRHFWSGHRNRILWTASLAGLCLVLTFGSIAMDMVLSARQLRDIDRAIASRFHQVFAPEVPMVDPIQQVRVRNRELAEDPLMAFSGNPTAAVDVLMALSRDVMGNLDIVLSRLSLDGEKLSIGGHAADFESVYEMKRRFEKPGTQTAATIHSASQDTALNRVVFSMDIARFRP